MKTSILKIQLRLLLLCFVVLVINACRKENPVRTASASKEEQAINAMKEKIKKEGTGLTTVYPINKVIPVQLINRSGESITLAALNSAKLNATYVCDHPGVVNVQTTLESFSRSYECGSGFKLAVTYNVSAPFNIVAANPSVPNTVTNGTIQLQRMQNGANIYDERDIPAVITPLGEDANNTDNFLFRLTFTTRYMLPFEVSNAHYLNTQVLFATDCDIYPYVGIIDGPYFISSRTNDPYGEPCTRTDKCFINPSMSGIPGSIAGSDVTGACTGDGAVRSQTHDFVYREITGFNPANWATTGTPGPWTVVPVPSVSNSGTTNGTIGYWEARTLPSTAFINNHVYEFMYRNHMITGTPCQGVWSAPERYLFN
jgi:hypothetical protein